MHAELMAFCNSFTDDADKCCQDDVGDSISRFSCTLFKDSQEVTICKGSCNGKGACVDIRAPVVTSCSGLDACAVIAIPSTDGRVTIGNGSCNSFGSACASAGRNR